MAATWEGLKAEIADRLAKDDLTAQIPYFIADAEARLNRVLQGPQMEDVSSSIVSAGTRTLTLPTNFLALRSIYIDGANEALSLEQVSAQTLVDRYPNEETGTPRFFALQAGNELVLGPIPSEDITLVINYCEKIPALGASQADNWLLLAHPDIYTAACMAEAHAFMLDEDRAMFWEQKLAGRVAEYTAQARRMQMSKSAAKLRTDLNALTGHSFDINRGY